MSIENQQFEDISPELENKSSEENNLTEPEQAVTEESPLPPTDSKQKSDIDFKTESLSSPEEQSSIRYAKQWCEIDGDSNLIQKSGSHFTGKNIGKYYSDSLLKKYVIKFNKLEDKVDELEKDFNKTSNKVVIYSRLKSLRDTINFSDGLGDFNSLLERLSNMENEILSVMEENYNKKIGLLKEAETLKDSTSWKSTSEKLKNLQDEWKKIGPVVHEKSDQIWNEFRAAIDIFFNNRQKFYDSRREEENNNLLAKQQLCEDVEKLIEAEDILEATKKVKEIQLEWNKIGFVPKQYTDLIWQRFREACDQIFNASREERNKKRQEFKFRSDERSKRLSEVLTRYQEKEKNLEASIVRDEENLSRWQEMRTRIKVTDNSQEFIDNLVSKISDVQEKMEQKKNRLEEVRKEIIDLEGKVAKQEQSPTKDQTPTQEQE